MVTRGYSRGGINWETRIDVYTLQYIKEITQNLLQNTGNSTQYSLGACVGKE